MQIHIAINMVEVKVVMTMPQQAIAIREKVKVGEIPQAFGEMFRELAPVLQKDVRCVGPPFAYYHSWSNDETDMEVGFPIAGEGITKGRIRPFQLPAVEAATIMHVGPYDKLMETYNVLLEWMKANGKKPASYMWEEYINSPDEVPPDKLMTRLVWPFE
jgi:AraC family transcriptional regulator